MSEHHGIIVLNKPVGITSAKALYRVRSIIGQRKSGHAGTLDPGASGVLLLCLGRATKLVETLMGLPKVYRAEARLDATSESFDSDSLLRLLSDLLPPSSEKVNEVARSFEGLIQQVPPRISALKVGGQPAYKLARRGHDFELPPRSVSIYWLRVHSYRWPSIDFEVCCGRGTYIRALIRDWGERLGTGGCLTSLVRTQIGPFLLENAWTFDGLKAADGHTLAIQTVETVGQQIDSSGVPARPI